VVQDVVADAMTVEAVPLVREDGTKADVNNDFARSQKISQELERDYGLQVYMQPEREYGERGVKPGARESAQRRGQVERRQRLVRQMSLGQEAHRQLHRGPDRLLRDDFEADAGDLDQLIRIARIAAADPFKELRTQTHELAR
jgi:hypothetical protein